MLFLIVGGVIAAFHLPVQNFPDIDARTIQVAVRSLGASPREVEEDINRLVEEAVVGLPGVERAVSTAIQGRGRIEVELAEFADSDAVLRDVQSAVEARENCPPSGRSARRRHN